MFEINLPELLVVALVALVVIGPKDMPKVMRALGGLAGKAKGFMNEMQYNIERFSREAEEAVGKASPEIVEDNEEDAEITVPESKNEK